MEVIKKMNLERWFISYRYIEKDFLTDEVIKKRYSTTVTDVTPAQWLLSVSLRMGKELHILYAEKISLALASELVHGGTGIHTNYFKEEG